MPLASPCVSCGAGQTHPHRFFNAQLESASIKTAEADEYAEAPLAREIQTLGVCGCDVHSVDLILPGNLWQAGVAAEGDRGEQRQAAQATQ